VVGVLFLLRGYRLTTGVIGGTLSAMLAVSAWLLPVDAVITLGSRVFKISDRFSILGRDFLLVNTDRAWLILIYLFLTLWIIGSLFARTHNGFVSFGFVFTALLVAALAVEPFLYAALLFEIAVLISVPFLAPAGAPPGRGIYRFLAFQTLGMPFILLAGWFLAGLEASPGESVLVLRAGALIGFGLAFLLSVVPFHSWIPALVEESEPYLTAFILFMLPAFVAVFGLGFLDRFVWLRESQGVYIGLRIVGILMVLVGGAWAVVERHLGRLLGYAAIIETGVGLLAVGIGSPEGILLFFWLMFVRVFSTMPWAASVSWLREENGSLVLSDLVGAGHRYPIAAGVLISGGFSLAGIPLLAGFGARFAFWQQISIIAPFVALAALAGNTGLIIASLRSLNALFISLPGSEVDLRGGQNGGLYWLLVGLLGLALLTIGLLPQLYLPAIEKLLFIFERLGA
jgi:formate hydrogenlyase subunit 3/multisubunit Na+/H+ antiporter MnhD subunit